MLLRCVSAYLTSLMMFANHVFQIYGIAKDSEIAFNRAIWRAQLMHYVTNLERFFLRLSVIVSWL